MLPWLYRIRRMPLASFFCLLLIYLIVTLSTKGILLSAPRFWAEEGVIYFPKAQADGWKSLFLVVNSNFQLLTNLGAILAAKMPLVFAPVATTYLALLFDLIAVALISVLVVQERLRLLPAVLLCTYWCLALPRYETALSATNIQWTCAFIGLLVMTQRSELTVFWKIVNTILVLTCGLTGIPTVILTPFFLAWALIDRSRYHAIIGGLLGLCALLHLYVLLRFGGGERHFMLSPEVLIGATWLQTVIAPLLGVTPADAIGGLMRDQTDSLAKVIALCITASGLALVVASCAALAGRRIGTLRAGILAALWILVAAIQIFGAVGNNPFAMLSAGGGGRYFLTSVMVATLMLALGASSPSRVAAITSLLVLFYINFVALAQYNVIGSIFINGPDWRNQIEACSEFPCDVVVWPGGAWVTHVVSNTPKSF